MTEKPAPTPAHTRAAAPTPADAPADAPTSTSAPIPTPTPAAPPDQPPPRRRSDSTREAIVVAARERFAADGYERATIRAIARDARIDPSMVMRYYGSKEGLFAAAVSVDLRLPDLGTLPRGEVGEALVSHLFGLWESSDVLTAMLRVASAGPAGAERMQATFREQLLPAARQTCPDPEQVATRAALVASQLLGFALTRYVLRLPPSVALSRAEIVAWLGPTVQRYLTAPSP
ncbi:MULTISPECIES: TetR/AcrR family transcriptional regulator [unclassified Streptomyces]|uniref:TetR/AcrR family transcriptional regulator n=1 Tax=unclassified Streptomyces TaxID=2593676 RepID=UPI00081B51D0|nr:MULTISPECIES: TetR family transcriptional regulator [unclassified Streptomyces]MYQ63807.1 TetR family transcriptional regulator [Streptomyces sp. SID4950]SCD66042.1 transcriptional regulator, TetR family [Streptomyces sp. SolWspMP-5a-2]